VRVIHVAPAPFGVAGVVGGAERYGFELARHMAREVPTTYLSFGTEDEERHEGPLHIRILGNPWLVRGQRTNPLTVRMFRALLDGDIVHFHQTHVLASSLGSLFCRAAGRLAFCTDLGGGGTDLSNYVSTDRWFHGHLHISDFSRRLAGHGTAANAFTIFGGVDAEKFSPGTTAQRGRRALYVGRLLPHKGLDDLIDAVEGEDELLVIGPVSNHEYVARLKRRAEGRRIEFRHDCTDADLVTEYRRASSVVLPSVIHDRDGGYHPNAELLGQTLLEAMACAAPVICTRVASMPEVVDDGCTGLIVPANDPRTLREAIVTLRDNPRRAEEMGRRGRARVLERFRWPIVVRACLDAYARRWPVGREAARAPA
jgi:glycosyltransferase involved in cell wall biosynthesis